MNTENGERGSRETSLSSLSSDGKPFLLVSAFPFPLFFLHPSFLSFTDSFSLPLLVCSSLRILLDLPSSPVIPAESSPVPSKVPVCRVSLFLPYYEYSRFSFFFFSLSLLSRSLALFHVVAVILVASSSHRRLSFLASPSSTVILDGRGLKHIRPALDSGPLQMGRPSWYPFYPGHWPTLEKPLRTFVPNILSSHRLGTITECCAFKRFKIGASTLLMDCFDFVVASRLIDSSVSSPLIRRSSSSTLLRE